MSQRFTIPLGEIRLAHFDLGNKAGLLDKIAKKDLGNKGILPPQLSFLNMSVPEGCVVLDEFYRYAIENGLARVDGTSVVIDNPAAFMDRIELPPITGNVAVRSAFTDEDRPEDSLAGKFETILNVPIESYEISPSRIRHPEAIAAAIAQVWSSGLKGSVTARMDVMIMRMIDPRHAGVPFTEMDFEDDLINYTTGLANDMLAGRVEGNTVELAKLQTMERPSKNYTNLPFAPRLQALLRNLRLALGKGNWDIEWADDGSKIWVIQVRPITAPTIRNEVFTYAPLKEALPELPSRFMATLIESAGDDIFNLYREIDPSLPTERRYIEVLHGRPMINLSLMMDMMRHWGEPTSHVTRHVGRAPNESRGNPMRLFKSRSQRLGIKIRAIRAVGGTRKVEQEMRAMSEHPGDSITEVIETARLVYAQLMRQMLLLRYAIGERYAGSGHSLGAQMYTELVPLRQLVKGNPDLGVYLSRGQVPRDTNFRLKWDAWLRKHGHRGVYETDLGRSRFHENPEQILEMIGQPGAEGPAKRHSPFAAFKPKSPAAKAALAREELRFDAMRSFDRIRRRLLELALPKGVSSEFFFSLSIEEARKLDSGWRPDSEFIEARKAEIEQLAGVRVPDVIRRNDAIPDGEAVSLHGVGLNRGEATGKALVLRDPVLKLPAGYEPGETILIAPSVDAGWVPTFGLVGGVVVESGGNLSHGSIILRELGIPSVTSVRGATREIKSGQRVHVVAAEGRVDLIG